MKLLLLLAVLALGAVPAGAIKVCSYNILNFPNDYVAREASFQIVMDEIDADLIVVQEIASWQAATRSPERR